MSVLVMTCPHCETEKMTMTAVCEEELDPQAAAQAPRLVVFRCHECMHGVLAETWEPPPSSRGFVGTRGSFREMARDANIFPKPRAIDIPNHLPDKVRTLFSEGTHIRGQNQNAALMVFRACLEAALKEVDPGIGNDVKLAMRIDRLAGAQKLPPAIQEWAHHIRVIGNDAAHADEPLASPEEAQELEGFVRHVLLYLFTLPEDIRQARQRQTAAP